MTDRVKQRYNSLSFDKIKVGDIAEFEHVLTQEDIHKFADLTGDYNPLHLDEEYAKKTYFRKPVVHGMLSASFISTLIGTKLPGAGALWTSQTIEFLRQTYIGDTLRIISTVKQKSLATRSIVLHIDITNQHDQKVISGESTVKLLEVESEENELAIDRNKTVLITGGSQGIGAAIAKMLADEGYSVAINYLKSKQSAENLVESICQSGGNSIAVQADVAVYGEVDSMFSTIETTFGVIDAVVHCAAPQNTLQPFSSLTWDDMQRQLDGQLKGAYNCAQRVLPTMVHAEKGALVFLGSIAAESTPPTQQTDYVVAKASLSALARSLAVEYGPKGIRINVVSPGMTQTDRIADYPEKSKMLTKMHTPLRQLAQPRDIANMVSFLISDKASHITGQVLRVCGGIAMV